MVTDGQNRTPTTAPSLYRKWRSRDFADVVGQAHVTQTLRNAVRYGSVGHAYLCTGPRGTGKTSTARILARAVNCLDPHDGEPCNSCAACLSILYGRCLDIVEIDAASNNRVDDVRDLRDKVNYAPTEVRRKVYIIDEVHMLSDSAFNALLKTLEEPPPHVLFVLATTDVHKVPATITSRCQRLDFRTISPLDIAARLDYVCAQEGISADAAALAMLAQQATGSLRDALSLLEQVRAYEGASIAVADVEQALGLARQETLADLTDRIAAGDAGGALALIGDLAASGIDMRQYARQLVQYWRDLLLLCASAGSSSRGRVAGAPEPRMAAQAGRLAVGDVTVILKAILQPDYSGRRSASAQWQLELAVAEASQHFAAEGVQPSRRVPAQAPAVRAAADVAVPSAVEVVEGRLEPVQSAPQSRPTMSGDAALSPAYPVVGAASPYERPAAPAQARADRSEEERSGEGSAASREPLPSPPPLQAPEPQAQASHHGVVSDVDRSRREPEPPRETPARGDESNTGEIPSTRPATAQTPQQVWARVRQILTQDGRGKVVALLKDSCSPVGLDGDVFMLGFTPQYATFHKRQIEAQSSKAPIEEALGRVVGRPTSLRCVTMDRPPAARDDTAAAPVDTFVDDATRLLRAIYTPERKSR